jgi:hypothetical protein
MSRPNTIIEGPNPSGLCFCGCGELTSVSPRTFTHLGMRPGDHYRFIPGHQRRKSAVDFTVEDRGFETPCHIWQRATNSGYGYLTVDGRNAYAHIFFWEQKNGPVPEGLVLDHAVCQTPACCNPDHLEAVTRAVNSRRGRHARASVEIALAIRAAVGTVSIAELARRHNLSRGAVYAIVHGFTWRNIE